VTNTLAYYGQSQLTIVKIFILYMSKTSSMEQHIFKLSPIIEGATEKVSQLIMSLKSNFNRIFYFNAQKCIFELHRNVKTISNLYNYNILVF
jgi:hypothetical protein